MVNLNEILNNVINDVVSIGFPISDKLIREIYIDKNRYDRVGACYRYKLPERFEIHLSENATLASKNEIKNIIAHEVLHACVLTMSHNCFWTTYQEIMNDKFGYNIKINYSWAELLNGRG